MVEKEGTGLMQSVCLCMSHGQTRETRETRETTPTQTRKTHKPCLGAVTHRSVCLANEENGLDALSGLEGKSALCIRGLVVKANQHLVQAVVANALQKPPEQGQGHR